MGSTDRPLSSSDKVVFVGTSKTSVPAIYDGEQVRLLEEAPVKEPYRVLVTFVEPAREGGAPDLFWKSFGAWREYRPVEETLEDIRKDRKSRTEPPTL